MDLWPAIYPKRVLNPDLRDAVRQSMANARAAKWQRLRGETVIVQGHTGSVLTTLADFPHTSELSRVLSVDKVVASPRMIARLKSLAQAVNFTGDIFECQQHIVEHPATGEGVAL